MPNLILPVLVGASLGLIMLLLILHHMLEEVQHSASRLKDSLKDFRDTLKAMSAGVRDGFTMHAERLFEGPVNTVEQGTPIPLQVGGVLVADDAETEQEPTDETLQQQRLRCPVVFYQGVAPTPDAIGQMAVDISTLSVSVCTSRNVSQTGNTITGVWQLHTLTAADCAHIQREAERSGWRVNVQTEVHEGGETYNLVNLRGQGNQQQSATAGLQVGNERISVSDSDGALRAQLGMWGPAQPPRHFNARSGVRFAPREQRPAQFQLRLSAFALIMLDNTGHMPVAMEFEADIREQQYVVRARLASGELASLRLPYSFVDRLQSNDSEMLADLASGNGIDIVRNLANEPPVEGRTVFSPDLRMLVTCDREGVWRPFTLHGFTAQPATPAGQPRTTTVASNTIASFVAGDDGRIRSAEDHAKRQAALQAQAEEAERQRRRQSSRRGKPRYFK